MDPRRGEPWKLTSCEVYKPTTEGNVYYSTKIPTLFMNGRKKKRCEFHKAKKITLLPQPGKGPGLNADRAQGRGTRSP
jgi:hypothetical protein